MPDEGVVILQEILIADEGQVGLRDTEAREEGDIQDRGSNARYLPVDYPYGVWFARFVPQQIARVEIAVT